MFRYHGPVDSITGAVHHAQVDGLERKRAECKAAVARKEEEVVDLLQERARDKASISDKEMIALELASPESPQTLYLPCRVAPM